ncbi:MAG: GNAT family N-acetyltransferase [Bdellovibrionales bacterium]
MGAPLTTLLLQSLRLNLRPYRAEDWAHVHEYGSDPEFSKFEAWGPNSEEDTKNFISDAVLQWHLPIPFRFEFATCLRESGRLIGGVGIRREAPTSSVGNLGWAIHPEWQNQGFATEAARRLLEFGFHELGLTVVYATCDQRNLASARVMQKLKMREAGVLPGDRMQKGHLRNTIRFELTRDEFQAL